MKSRFRFLMYTLPSLLAVAVIAEGTAHANTIATNIQYQNAGNYGCLAGLGSPSTSPCTAIGQANALTNNTSTGPTNFSYAVNLADGDNYILSGNYTGSYSETNGSSFIANATLTYVGASPSAQADTVQVDIQEAIYDTNGTSYNGTYNESAYLCGPSSGAGWTLSAQEFIGGGGVGLLGPVTACQAFFHSASLVGLTNPLLSEDWQFNFTINAGATNGYGVSTITPEPAETLPAALVLGLLACVTISKRRKENLVK